MDIQAITEFFKWCTILNGILLVFSFVVIARMGDSIYSIHSRWFPMSRDRFFSMLYVMIGIYKMLVFVFNLAPWVALVIIA